MGMRFLYQHPKLPNSKLPIVVAGAILVALAACDQIVEPHFVTLELPAAAEAWDRLLEYQHYEVCWYNTYTRPTCQTVAVGSQPRLDFPRLLQSPVLVTPIGTIGPRLPSAGALYPASIGADGRLVARWQDGSAVSLLYALFPRLGGLATFNAERFLHEVWERTEGRPWELDRDRVIDAFTEGRISATRIARRPSHPVAVAAPLGDWRPIDPFGMSTITDADGVARFGELGVGTHWFIDASGRTEQHLGPLLGVQVTEDGRVTTIISE